MRKCIAASFLILVAAYTYAGLPPTTSKGSGDSTNVTTFNYQFPNLAVTHSGVTAVFPTYPVPSPSPSACLQANGAGTAWLPVPCPTDSPDLWSTNGTDVWRPAGNVGIGTTAPIGTLVVSESPTRASWTTAGTGLVLGGGTFTDSTSTGTVATEAIHAIAAPTLAASSATTFTNADTLYVAGGPVAGTNVTETDAWGIHNAGKTFSEGQLVVGTTAVGLLGTARAVGDGIFTYITSGTAPLTGVKAGSLYTGSTNTSSTIKGGIFQAFTDPASTANLTNNGTAGGLNGARYVAFHAGTGTVTSEVGMSAQVGTTGSNASPITNAYTFSADVPTVNASSSIGKSVQMLIRGGSTAGTITSRFGIQIENMGSGTSRFAIAQEGTADTNYFLGNTGIGTTTPQNKLDVFGAAAIGSYGGTNAGPTNGLIVSGNTGIGTSSPTSQLHLVGLTYPTTSFTDLLANTRYAANRSDISFTDATAPSNQAAQYIGFSVNPNASWTGKTAAGTVQQVIVPSTSTQNIGNLTGFQNNVGNAGSGTSTNTQGVVTNAINLTGAGNATSLIGVNATAANQAASTVTTQVTGVLSQPQNSGAGTVATLKGFRAALSQTGSSTTSGDAIGLEIANFTNTSSTVSGVTYGVKIGTVVAGTQTGGSYSLFAGDTAAPNYFGGNVGIGSTAPAQKLDVTGNGAISGALTLGTALNHAYGGTDITSPGTAGNVLTSDGANWVSSANGNAPTGSNLVLGLGIAASVSANALTIAFKQPDGSTNPDSSNPVKIGFRNATATTGGYSQVSLTTGASLIVPSGATIGTVSGIASYIYVYAINNAGSIEPAVSLSGNFDNGTTLSTNALSGGSSNATILYSTSARSGVAVRLVGRINISEATAGTWATGATEVSVLPFKSPSTSEYTTADTSNGVGSTGNRMKKFTNVGSNTTSMTWNTDAVNGYHIDIGANGTYSFFFSWDTNVGSDQMAIVKNASGSTTTNPYSQSASIILCIARTPGAGGGTPGNCSWTGPLSSGDSVWFNQGAGADGTTNLGLVRATKIN